VELLVKFGAEVDAQDNDNMTPLLLAPAGEMYDSFFEDDTRCTATSGKPSLVNLR